MLNFKPQEFTCPCCGRNEMSRQLLEMLQKARTIANIPFIINSAFRCESHNKKVSKFTNSPHLGGFAVDIKITNSQQRFIIIESLIKAGFKRIGVGETFIHVDIDPSKTPVAMWGYW